MRMAIYLSIVFTGAAIERGIEHYIGQSLPEPPALLVLMGLVALPICIIQDALEIRRGLK